MKNYNYFLSQWGHNQWWVEWVQEYMSHFNNYWTIVTSGDDKSCVTYCGQINAASLFILICDQTLKWQRRHLLIREQGGRWQSNYWTLIRTTRFKLQMKHEPRIYNLLLQTSSRFLSSVTICWNLRRKQLDPFSNSNRHDCHIHFACKDIFVIIEHPKTD